MSTRRTRVTLAWPRDDGIFFRRLVDAVASSEGSRGVSAASLWQPFHGPARRFYNGNRDIDTGARVTLEVSWSSGGSVTIRREGGGASRRPGPPIPTPLVTAVDPWGELLVTWLQRGTAVAAVADFVTTGDRVELRRFQVTEDWAGQPRPLPAQRAVANFMEFLRPARRAEYPRIHTARFVRGRSEWSLDSFVLLGEVRPLPEGARQMESAEWFDVDDGLAIIADVRAARQLVLDNAALLIAEQDPTRLDNLLMSVAPFAVMRVGRLARFARLSRASILRRIRRPRVAPLRRGRYHADVPVNPQLLDRALELRKTRYGVELNDFRTNMTVWEVTVDGRRTFLDAGNVPVSALNRQHGRGVADVGFHSEGIVAQQVLDMRRQGRNVQVRQIYTERVCCPNCLSLLDSHDAFRNAAVFHSVGDQRGPRAAAVMEAYGIVP